MAIQAWSGLFMKKTDKTFNGHVRLVSQDIRRWTDMDTHLKSVQLSGAARSNAIAKL